MSYFFQLLGSKEDEMTDKYNSSIFISQKSKTLERAGTKDSDYYSLRVSCNIQFKLFTHLYHIIFETVIPT